MNEPMHLVPRADILSIMQMMADLGLKDDDDSVFEIYNRLDEITEKKPDNQMEKIA